MSFFVVFQSAKCTSFHFSDEVSTKLLHHEVVRGNQYVGHLLGASMAIDAATELNILSLGLSFLMGSALVWLGLRQIKANMHARMTLVQLGLLFLVNTIIFILYIVRSNQDSLGYSDTLLFLFYNVSFTLNSFTLAQILMLTMMYPLVFTTSRESLFSWYGGIAVGLLVMFIIAFAVDGEGYSKIDNYWGFVTIAYWTLASILLIRIYMQFRNNEDNSLRNASIAAGLLLFALMGAGSLQWPFLFFPLASPNGPVVVWSLRYWGTLTYTSISVAMVFILWKEITVHKDHRDKTLLTLAIVYLMIGFLNMLVQLILEDGEFQELWDYFVIEGSFGLLRPLIVILIALRFNLFELSNEHIRGRVRILALLIITVWASGFFEIVQAFVPMPQLLSAALIGVALAFAIGWEDRVFEGLMDDSTSRQVPEVDFFEDGDLYKLIMMTVAGVLFSVCLGFVGTGGVV